MIATATPLARASMLLLAKRRVTLRLMGDVPGHEFHGNQWTTMYHGTRPENIDSIRREGINPTVFEGKIPYAWAADKKSAARIYGSHVLKIRAPKSAFEAIKTSVNGRPYTAYRFKEKIKPEWLQFRAAGDVPGHEFHGNQWTEGQGGSGVFYHGTSRARLASILKDGIKAEHAGENYGQSIKQNVFISTTQKEAEFWGGHTAMREHVAGSGPIRDFVVLRVEIPKSELSKLKADKQAKGDALKFKGDIKPEWIKGHTVHSSMLGKPPMGLEAARIEPDATTVWIAVILHEQSKARMTAQHPERAVHVAADRHLKPMTLAVRAAFNLGRKAYKSGGVDAAAKAVRSALLKTLPPALLATMKSGGEVALGTLRSAQLRTLRPQVKGEPRSKQPPFNLAFNVDDPRAVQWANDHALELADGISETTKEDLRQAIADALAGDGIDAAYDAILEAVGDDARAETIARTEIMSAANEGQRAGWQQAQDEGLLPEDAQVTWIATAGACDDCEALDGATRDLNGEYDDPDAGDGPPLHPNCRCTEGIA